MRTHFLILLVVEQLKSMAILAFLDKMVDSSLLLYRTKVLNFFIPGKVLVVYKKPVQIDRY
jgi:hypothetical protein